MNCSCANKEVPTHCSFLCRDTDGYWQLLCHSQKVFLFHVQGWGGWRGLSRTESRGARGPRGGHTMSVLRGWQLPSYATSLTLFALVQTSRDYGKHIGNSLSYQHGGFCFCIPCIYDDMVNFPYCPPICDNNSEPCVHILQWGANFWVALKARDLRYSIAQ